MKGLSKKKISALEVEYHDLLPKATRLMHELRHQIERMIESKTVVLGVPIESRVKTWQSILRKLEKKSLPITKITDIADLIGIRVILLFKRDAEVVCKLLTNVFNVVDKDDKFDHLGVSEFGYVSVHLRVKQPESWNSVPSFENTGELHAEIQVRSLAQHIWAAASHVLQYKSEADAPKSVRRSINRAAALLETVDLEFERVLDLRADYVKQADSGKRDGELNVDLLAKVLDQMFPKENKKRNEAYADLLQDLQSVGITNAQQLKILVEKWIGAALKADARMVESCIKNKDYVGTSPERIARGVYFSHAGLLRTVIDEEYGDNWRSNRE